jgi:hypothetical protein
MEYVTTDGDIDVEKCRQGFREIALALVPNKQRKKQRINVEEAKENEASIANKKARGETAADGRAVTNDGGGGAGAPSTPSVPPCPISNRRIVRSKTSLMKPQLLKLRLSLRVTPLATWSTKRDSYVSAGAALELPIAPIPYSLHSYAHGGFMGLGCSIIEDTLWKRILESEDPHAWSAVQQ